MIDIRIPKEIRQYEAKFVGPFTMRQTICVGVGLPICILLYNILRPLVSRDLMGFCLLLPAAAIFLFGWVKPYGMKFEQFFFSAVMNNFIAPRRRKYITINRHEALLKAINKFEEQQSKNGNKHQKRKYVKSNLAIR
ncbi:MAG: PrgI family protein [Oscillospiraceae bacterium]|nr:PrgI family protein [Oscillospiraceae bacterium]